MFVDRRPFPTASGSLNFDFGKEYGRTPQVLAEGGVLKAPALEGIKEETLPPNQDRQDDSEFMFNGVYYQPWARDVKPLFQGSRMTPPLNYNRLPIGSEHLKRGVDRGGSMIDEEGKLVHVANYASNFKLKGNSAQELRRSFLLQSAQQQGGELGYFNVVPPEAINRLQQATREQGLGTPAGNDLTAQADDQFFTPPQTERQLRQRQPSASGAGASATAESGLTATSGTSSAEINESNIEQLSRNELSDNFTSEQLIEEARRHNVPQDVYLKQNDEPRAHNQIAKKLKSYFSSKKKK